jgi:hypothetical protein
MIYLVILCLLGLWYIAYRVEKIHIIVARQAAEKEAADDEDEEATMNPAGAVSSAFLPEEWTDVPFSWKSRQEKRRPLENPNLLRSPDEFISAEIIARLKSISEPLDRIAFLSSLRLRQTYFNETITGVILRDPAIVVRAWGAATLETEFRDYRDYEFGEGKEAPLSVDYGGEVSNDPEPLVRASQWKHNGYRDLLWGRFRAELKGDWKPKFRELSQLERLAMMHNIGLPYAFVVGLLQADTSELGITREEHARLLFSAAQNPHLIVSSRHHGREVWAFEGDANSPFEEFGQMWEACVDKWMDQQHVVFSFLKYTQTTPQVKFKVYGKLIGMTKAEYLRKAIIEGCDAFTDKIVLKAAWDDPDEECKKAAQEVVGNLKNIVGVK